MKKIIISLIILFSNSLLFSSDIQKAKLLYVIDGDTIIVDLSGKHEKVRLIGIDCPETRNNYKAKRDSEKYNISIDAIISKGFDSKIFVRNLVKKNTVLKIEYDVEKRDKYGRLLAYVYLSDGRMLNEVIVKSGHAYLMTIYPNVKYRDLFREAYSYAKKYKLGMWNKYKDHN